MREIKFRQYVWNDDSKTTGGRMQDWDELLSEEAESLSSIFTTKFSNASLLMQYTGLKDKNGTDIYEGDIVKTKYNNAVLIKWIKTGFYPCRQGKTDQYNKVTNWDCVIRGEVIGNIYENRELLKLF